MKKITKVILFSGGSGNQELIKVLKDIKNIDFKIISNCYDDGKSTGRIRDLIPGFLGPSDIRKNIGWLLSDNDFLEVQLKKILEKRFEKLEFKKLRNFFLNNNFDKDRELVELFNNLSFKKFFIIKNYVIRFCNYMLKKRILSEKDMSLGNIIFAGIFLYEKNFNKAVAKFSLLFGKPSTVYNITDGQNLYLNALREDGEIIKNEEDLVSKSGSKIKNIFLHKVKISNIVIKKISSFNFEDKNFFLEKKNIYPKINKTIIPFFKKADLIIYGPGTQFSSLYPSYLTQNIASLISKSLAKKILITNIHYDKDIKNETLSSLIDNFYYFMKKKNTLKIANEKLVNEYYAHSYDNDDKNLVNKSKYLIHENLRNKNLKLLDWEKDKGVHFPKIVLQNVFKKSDKKILKQLSKSFFSISIIVPCLNEEKTIRNVLQKLNSLNIDGQLLKEIIVVDGGSTDKTIKYVKNFKFCKLYTLENSGKGDALRFGIKKSKGDIVVFFPSDDEYNINDINKSIIPILNNQTEVVFGSRLIKCINLSDQIKKIYKNNYLDFIISKYGGYILSILCLIFFNKYITDPLTSIKAFKADTIKNLKLESKGFEIELEIIAKLSKIKTYIFELPVNFLPRSKEHGKKITFLDGMKSIWIIIKNGF